MFNRKANSCFPADGAVASSAEQADRANASPMVPDEVSLPATIRRYTLLAAGTVIDGNVIITGDCQVCGYITGSVILHEGVLRVMKGGRIEGDVQAPAVTIDGSIYGSCDAEVVDILENGHLDGLCRCRQFSILTGGVFIGRSERRVEQTITDKNARTVTDLPSRRTRHLSSSSAADRETGVQADG